MTLDAIAITTTLVPIAIALWAGAVVLNKTMRRIAATLEDLAAQPRSETALNAPAPAVAAGGPVPKKASTEDEAARKIVDLTAGISAALDMSKAPDTFDPKAAAGWDAAMAQVRVPLVDAIRKATGPGAHGA